MSEKKTFAKYRGETGEVFILGFRVENFISVGHALYVYWIYTESLSHTETLSKAKISLHKFISYIYFGSVWAVIHSTYYCND